MSDNGNDKKQSCPCCGPNRSVGEMMKMCVKCNKWCPVICVVFGVFLFLIGVFFTAEVIKALWLILSVLIILMGIGCFIMMKQYSNK